MNQGKMKIAFFHRANDPYTLERIRYFQAKKYDVYSISISEDGYQDEIGGVNVIKLKKLIIDRLPFAKLLSHYYELKNILKRIKPDILHVVSALNLFYTNTKYGGIKIIENQGSDVILIPLKHKFLKHYYKFYYNKVDGIIQDSQVAYESGLKYGANNNPELNKIIEIGIDFKIFNKNVEKGIIRKKYNLENRKIVFHSRNIIKIYNIDIVLKSLLKVREKFPDCVYILTTTMDKFNIEMKDFIKNNDLEKNLLLVGYQDRLGDLKYFYRDADVNISVPSSDSSPFSVYESMACMTPNIVTDLPWVSSKFIPGKHLITCPVRNSEILADDILEVLTGQHKLDLESAYQTVYEKINLESENKKLETLYLDLAQKKVS